MAASEPRRPLITLLTDFGSRDAYVAAMKGVILSHLPEARIIDICHEIPAHDIRAAGFIWSQAVPFFPAGAVHVAVVDPGVGSRRKLLAVEGRGARFLAPDNGLIGFVLKRREIRRVLEVSRRRFFLGTVSATFHGRDILAPVAARLAAGLPLEELGPPVRAYHLACWPRARRRRLEDRWTIEARGEVIHIDTFGNAITNLEPQKGFRFRQLQAGAVVCRRLSRTYASARKGEAIILVGSAGFLEIAQKEGQAAREFGIRIGDRVVASWTQTRSRAGG